MFVRQPPTDASTGTTHHEAKALHQTGRGLENHSNQTVMTRPLQIFLVEDSAEIREALTQTLESAGHMTVVGYADNANDAIRAMESQPIDAAVIDLHLREGSGLEVLAHLARSNPKNILRVVLTNHTAPMFRRASEKLGADHFLDKSMEFERAVEVLAEHAQHLSSSAG
jgi:two-component system OmpR family response regulator